MAAFVAILIISNVASTKILLLGPLTFDGGTVLFPLAYIFGDVLTEVYGYARSRRVIWTGFVWLAVAAAVFALVDWLPAAPGWELQSAFDAILGQTPRIVAGSLVAFLAGEFANSFVLAKLKLTTRGRWLWVRTIGSTIVGEGVDTAIFLAIAFWGVLPEELLLTVFVSNYVFKVGVEAIFTPVTYRVVNALKRSEGEDYYDWKTNFSPFTLSTR
ncbi:MAG: queuosine precursor transporter [Chloroflexota bacterium]